ncbi:hypothetical protein ODJ79_35745 [Actinoplanes sp. KI2]|uniref:hypothetical protein n=1 Tax=Actinoplanes sp. KI2 TaxID=2983315 RepID=UPI0021D5D1B2|nr:hypothetical protein [Actinoplanes sp. KI2]MCU7729097.1 hypothetical protein [Actinoplanes sp. KI2]
MRVPATLPQAVREELRRALHPPYDLPLGILGNGVLLVICWTLLPARAVDALFRFQGPFAFAMVLALWIYSDVPVTNPLCGDAGHSIAALDDPAALRRLLYAKNIAMWLLATPLCVLVAAAIGVTERRPVTFLVTASWIVLVPLGALGAAAWVGIRWPYHPLPLRERWAGRRRWRPMLLRWTVLILAPFLVVPFLTAVLTVPGLLVWWWAGHGGRVTDGQFAAGVLLTAVLAAVAWPAGHRRGARLARRRREQLAAYLADPAQG